jgi:hypothetical protein
MLTSESVISSDHAGMLSAAASPVFGELFFEEEIFFDEAVLLPALLWSLVSGWSATTEKVPEAHPSS